MKRVSAPERTRERLRAIMDGRLGTAPERSSLVLLAAQLILEEALEGEVRDAIGRERYARVGIPTKPAGGTDPEAGRCSDVKPATIPI